MTVIDKKTFDRDAITNIIPHRYENILLDYQENFEEEGLGKYKLTITENDELDRDIFFKTNKTLLEPTYMEIQALSAIVSMGDLPDGMTVYFSAITNFKKAGDITLGKTLMGEVNKAKAKAGFHKFSGSLTDEDGNEIAKGGMMAFGMPADADMSNADKKQVDLPELTMDKSIDKGEMKWKNSALFFADKVVDLNDDSITTEYIYPSDHPFTKGHFPGNPVMMGITQWVAAGDAMWQFACEKNLAKGSQKITLSADIEIVKDSGVIASEIKKCVCEIDVVDNKPGSLDIIETKKIYFRDMIRPEDKLYIKVTNISVS